MMTTTTAMTMDDEGIDRTYLPAYKAMIESGARLHEPGHDGAAHDMQHADARHIYASDISAGCAQHESLNGMEFGGDQATQYVLCTEDLPLQCITTGIEREGARSPCFPFRVEYMDG